jgi:hypothetical protein
MTLGSGALHSEQNASETEPMRFIQIWILPDTAGLPPEVEQRVFTKADRTDRLLRVVGPVGEASEFVKVHQDASVYVASLDGGGEVVHPIGSGRGTYLYLIDGAASFDDKPVVTGAAARVTAQPEIRIRPPEPSELILVDVPMQFEAVGIWRGRLG